MADRTTGRNSAINNIDFVAASVKTKKGFRVSSTELRPFIFSHIQLTGVPFPFSALAHLYSFTDDDQYIETNISEHMGDIAIELMRCTVGTDSQRLIRPTEIPIHEREKEAIVHQVGYECQSSLRSFLIFIGQCRYLDSSSATSYSSGRPHFCELYRTIGQFGASWCYSH